MAGEALDLAEDALQSFQRLQSRRGEVFRRAGLGWRKPHRIHGAAIYGNMDPINIPPLC